EPQQRGAIAVLLNGFAHGAGALARRAKALDQAIPLAGSLGHGFLLRILRCSHFPGRGTGERTLEIFRLGCCADNSSDSAARLPLAPTFPWLNGTLTGCVNPVNRAGHKAL